MKHLITLIILIVTVALGASGQQLKFRPSGEFKILQFTDLHYILNDPRCDAAIDCIGRMAQAEKPDLIVTTGDNIFGQPGLESMRKIAKTISDQGIPFVMLFGNHDEDYGATHHELYDAVQALPHCIQPKRPAGVESPDYVLTVSSHDGKHEALHLYMLDSHSHTMGPLKRVGHYAWLTHDQVLWYRQQCTALKTRNGGDTVPALAFWHIPTPEWREVATSQKAVLVGTRKEAVCCPEVNSGMMAAMLEGGDVMGVFCGHDHDNDYAALWQGILLAYGRYSGGNTVYNNLPNGARVIVLREGQRQFETYVRLRQSGEVINRITVPDYFLKK